MDSTVEHLPFFVQFPPFRGPAAFSPDQIAVCRSLWCPPLQDLCRQVGCSGDSETLPPVKHRAINIHAVIREKPKVWEVCWATQLATF